MKFVLGYQAGVVSFQCPTYRRMRLSMEHHAGDTVSDMQVEVLVLAAKKRSGQHPERRTDLLQKRIEDFVKTRAPAKKRLSSQQVTLAAAEQAKAEVLVQLQPAQETAEAKPKRIQMLERRRGRCEKAVEDGRKKLNKTKAWLNRTPGAGTNPAPATGTVRTGKC
jgi:septal ring factor EnvC (AmiA/AmiB activator)